MMNKFQLTAYTNPIREQFGVLFVAGVVGWYFWKKIHEIKHSKHAFSSYVNVHAREEPHPILFPGFFMNHCRLWLFSRTWAPKRDPRVCGHHLCFLFSDFSHFDSLFSTGQVQKRNPFAFAFLYSLSLSLSLLHPTPAHLPHFIISSLLKFKIHML
jgi:hypothetical protein